MSSKVVAEEHYPPGAHPETLEYALLNTIAIFIESCQRKIRELIAISVILPGLVDPESGVIRYMPHIQVENWGLVEALENALKSPALLVTIFAARRWLSTISGQVRIAKTPFWCECTAEPGQESSPMAEFSSVAMATSARLVIFR